MSEIRRKGFSSTSAFLKLTPGFLSHPITKLDTINFSDIRVRAYTSIFPNISTLSFDLGITYIGVFKSQEVDLVYINVMVINCGSKCRFANNVNFSP